MNTRRFLIVSAVLAMAALLASPALADRSVDETISMGRADGVKVQAITGELTIRGVSGSQVRVTGTIGDDVTELIVEIKDGNVVIRPDIPKNDRDRRWNKKRNNDVDVELEVEMPRNAKLIVESVTAPVRVRDLDGPVSVQAVTGNVKITGSMNRVEVQNVSGNIEVGSSASLRTGEFETVSGNIELHADVDDDARLDFNTLSGEVVLHVGSVSASFDINTFSGDIKNDFGYEAERTGEFSPGKQLEFSVGGGSARISINTFSGTVRLLEK